MQPPFFFFFFFLKKRNNHSSFELHITRFGYISCKHTSAFLLPDGHARSCGRCDTSRSAWKLALPLPVPAAQSPVDLFPSLQEDAPRGQLSSRFNYLSSSRRRLMHLSLETRINILVLVCMARLLGTAEAWSQEY